ncbi:MAG TPA: GntR family transcriptional regulator [Anaerolineae bacterium]|nr:GntR family transcriptional regulator [Anaerolineae bacterium]
MPRTRRSASITVPATIDRDSHTPAYAQLVDILRAQVAAGVLRPGDQIPSEAQLCERYGLSPMTVRRAINILADAGVISAHQGKGTFVKPLELGEATFGLNALQNLFSDEEHTTVKLLEARVLPADERTARKLAIESGERVIYIRRLLCTEAQPAFYHREYLIYDPARPIVESELEVTALQRLFSGSGATLLKHGELSIEATILNEEEARLLQMELPAAAFCIEHLFYDFDNRPISWGWFICRSDRLRFATHVGVPAAPRPSNVEDHR